MKALLQQTLQQIKLDSELKRLLGNRSDIDEIIRRLQIIFENTLDNHTELYWKREHAHTKAQLECSIQECLSLRHDLREMDEDRTDKSKIIKEQTKQIDELQIALGEIEQKLNAMQDNILSQKQELAEEFEQNLNQIEDSYKQKEVEQIQNLTQKLNELEQVVSDQQAALAKEKEYSLQAGKEIKQLKSQIKTEQENVTNLRQQVQTMKKNNETINIDKQCLDNRSKQLKQQNETLHKQVRQLETKIIDLNEECERQKKKSQHDTVNYKSQQSEQEKIYKRKIRNYKLQIDETKSKLKISLQKIFGSLKVEIDSMRLQTLKEITSTQTQIAQMIIKQLKQDFEQKERGFSDKMEQIRYSMQAHFKNTLDKQTQDFDHKEQQLKNEYELIIKALKSQVEGLENIQRDIEKELKLKSIENEENQLILQEKIELLTDQQKQLQELSEQSKEQLNLLLEQDAQIKEFKENNDKYQRKTLQYEEYINKQTLVYQSQKGDERSLKKQQCEDLTISNQQLRKQIAILQEQLQSDQNAITKLKSQVSTAKLTTIKDVEERHQLRMQNIRKI